MARMEEDLGLSCLPPTLVYTTRTIRATAEALAALEGGAAEPGGAILAEVWAGPERPVSSNQQQMWMLWEAGLGAAYNMQVWLPVLGISWLQVCSWVYCLWCTPSTGTFSMVAVGRRRPRESVLDP